MERSKREADKRLEDEIRRVKDQAQKDLDEYRRRLEEAKKRRDYQPDPNEDLIEENNRLGQKVKYLGDRLESARNKQPETVTVEVPVNARRVPTASIAVMTSFRKPETPKKNQLPITLDEQFFDPVPQIDRSRTSWNKGGRMSVDFQRLFNPENRPSP